MSRVCAANIRHMIQEGVMCRLKSGRMVRKPLVEPVTKKRLKEPIEGSVFDLTLQIIYVPKMTITDHNEVRRILASGDTEAIVNLCCPSLLGPNERRLSDVTPLLWHNVEGKAGRFLAPGAYLLESRETINLPDTLAGPLQSKSSVFRGFAALHISEAIAGYQGKITALLTVHHPIGFTLLQSTRFAYVYFERFDSDKPEDIEAYNGIWGTQGFSITTNGQTVRPY